MKRLFFFITLIFCFILMLSFPSVVFQGAEKGLLLWFHTVFPTLFPFMIISSYIVQSGALRFISKLTGPFFRRLFHVSDISSFAILCGFLCGYPMGARTASELAENKLISSEEAAYLLSFCNNTSPMFALNFILLQNIGDPDLVVPGLCILILAPLITGQLCYFFYHKKRMYNAHQSFSQKKLLTHDAGPDTSSMSPISSQVKISPSAFQILDQCIMKSMESIVQVGGYIILFSVFISLIKYFPIFEENVRTTFLCSLEITNGVMIVCQTNLSLALKWIACLSLSSFGGFCAVAQTSCMTNHIVPSFSLRTYTIEKLVTAMITSLLAYGYLIVSNYLL